MIRGNANMNRSALDPDLSSLHLATGMLAWWPDYKGTDLNITVYCKNLNQKEGAMGAK